MPESLDESLTRIATTAIDDRDAASEQLVELFGAEPTREGAERLTEAAFAVPRLLGEALRRAGFASPKSPLGYRYTPKPDPTFIIGWAMHFHMSGQPSEAQDFVRAHLDRAGTSVLTLAYQVVVEGLQLLSSELAEQRQEPSGTEMRK
ncbi:hypothetical protein [Amycolatopsis sp. NPDC059657]|uniref:hypothetical protein n=1 Tax=Amycolatopsis sp. NPDC059657 TaxID=3346899 RepID=UPI0036728006